MIEVLGVWVTWMVIQYALFDATYDDWKKDKDYYKRIPRKIDWCVMEGRYMLVKEHTTKYKQTKIGEFRLNRSYTMDEDIMTGETTNKRLVKFSIQWRK